MLETLSRRPEDQSAAGGIRPWKGVLDWPVRGTIIETFGRHRHPKFDTWTVSNGVAVAVPPGTPVRAVYAGKAMYAQWLAEYGNLVILDHGDGMLTLYAWLQGIAVRPGIPVAVGSDGRSGRLGTGARRTWPVFRGAGPAKGQRSGGMAEIGRAARWRGITPSTPVLPSAR